MIRYHTELARLIWWKAQMNTEYFRVGLSWMVFTAMFLGTGLWYVGTEAKKLPKDSWIYFGLTVAAGVWFPFYMKGDQDVVFFMGLFLHGAAVYWLLSVTGSIRGIELDERGVGDLLRGFFVLPFSGYPERSSERDATSTHRCRAGKMGTCPLTRMQFRASDA